MRQHNQLKVTIHTHRQARLSWLWIRAIQLVHLLCDAERKFYSTGKMVSNGEISFYSNCNFLYENKRSQRAVRNLKNVRRSIFKNRDSQIVPGVSGFKTIKFLTMIGRSLLPIFIGYKLERIDPRIQVLTQNSHGHMVSFTSFPTKCFWGAPS